MGAESSIIQGLQPSLFTSRIALFHSVEELKQVRGFEGELSFLANRALCYSDALPKRDYHY